MGVYRTEGIISLDAGEEIVEDIFVASIHLNGSASGDFVIELGGVTVTVTTADTDIQVQRRLSSLKLVSGPTSANLIAFLK